MKQIIDDFFLILFMSWMDSFPLQADKDHTTIQRFFFKLFEFSLFFIAAFYWPLVVIPLLVVLTFEGYIRYRKEEDEKEREAPKKWH
ncbi:MAG TPA: hypothetical protein PKN62_03385 [bacterium]|nr:hypothetical protein [bacterium]